MLRQLLILPTKRRRAALFPKIRSFCRGFGSSPVVLNYTTVKDQDHAKTSGSSNLNMVIMHGLFGSGTNWTTIARKLCQTGACETAYLMDLRNHGKSAHLPTMSWEEMVEDVHLTHETLFGAEKVIYMGHSMGGKVLMEFAMNHSHLISKMIVVDVAPVSYSEAENIFREYLNALQAIDLNQIKSRREADSALIQTIANERIRSFLLSNLEHVGTGLKWKPNLKAIENWLPEIRRSTIDENSQCSVPSLFIGGDKSTYILPEYIPLIKKIFTKSAVEYLPGGHWIHVDAMERFVEKVTSFCKREPLDHNL